MQITKSINVQLSRGLISKIDVKQKNSKSRLFKFNVINSSFNVTAEKNLQTYVYEKKGSEASWQI